MQDFVLDNKETQKKNLRQGCLMFKLHVNFGFPSNTSSKMLQNKTNNFIMMNKHFQVLTAFIHVGLFREMSSSSSQRGRKET